MCQGTFSDTQICCGDSSGMSKPSISSYKSDIWVEIRAGVAESPPRGRKVTKLEPESDFKSRDVSTAPGMIGSKLLATVQGSMSSNSEMWVKTSS